QLRPTSTVTGISISFLLTTSRTALTFITPGVAEKSKCRTRSHTPPTEGVNESTVGQARVAVRIQQSVMRRFMTRFPREWAEVGGWPSAHVTWTATCSLKFTSHTILVAIDCSGTDQRRVIFALNC